MEKLDETFQGGRTRLTESPELLNESMKNPVWASFNDVLNSESFCRQLFNVCTQDDYKGRSSLKNYQANGFTGKRVNDLTERLKRKLFTITRKPRIFID
jgi:hypothetical protein